MAKIKNTTKYPIDYELIGNEMLIGSDSDGVTMNFKLSDIKSYIVSTANDIAQDNVIIPIYTARAASGSLADACNVINNGAFFEVTDTNIIYFRVPRLSANVDSESEGFNISIPDTLIYDWYWLQRKGKGTYGVGGNKTVTVADLLWFKTSEVYSLPTSPTGEAPIVYQLTTTDINSLPEDILNNAVRSGGFEITNDTDYYFEINEVESLTSTPNYTGEMKIYRFVGDAGTYGASGADTAVNSDFVLVEINDEGINPNTFLTLTDVQDTTYSGKMGYAPVVSLDESGSNDAAPSLKLVKIPKFSDIYKTSGIIRGGVTPLGGLTYNIWATGYVINNVYYDIPVSANVTLSDGGANPRFDVFAIRVNAFADPLTASIIVIEGTESTTPVKPTVNSSTDVEVSFKLLLAGETTDPTFQTETVFDDNAGEPTEWDNIFLLTGGDLADTSAPYKNTSCFSIGLNDLVAANDKRIVWRKSSTMTFSPDNLFVFALKTTSGWNINSKINIKLSNSSSPTDTWSIGLNASTILNYGFSQEVSGWRLVSIRMADFSTSALSTEYDTVEFTLDSLPDVSIDWINIQSGVPTSKEVVPMLELEAGDNVTIDYTNPQKPKISASALRGAEERGNQIDGDYQLILGDFDDVGNSTKIVLDDATGYITVPSYTTALINAAGSKALTTKEFVEGLVGNKADDTAVVKLTGNQTIAGIKTFSSAPKSSVDASVATDLVRKSQMDTALALKANDNVVVKISGTQTISGAKTFSSVPSSSADATVGTNLVRKSQMDTALALKANDNSVVKLAGKQNVKGDKTFDIPPKSLVDATSSTELVRYSQFIGHNPIIPMTVLTSNMCMVMPPENLSRFVCNFTASPEICILPVLGDVDKEIIFTNLSTVSCAVSVSSAEFYNIVRSGLETPVTSFASKVWVRARVAIYSGTPYFLILEKGTIAFNN